MSTFQFFKKAQADVQEVQDLTEEQLLKFTGGAASPASPATNKTHGKHLAKGHKKTIHGKGKAKGHSHF